MVDFEHIIKKFNKYLVIREKSRIFTYIPTKKIKTYIMSWYENFKTGTKDYLVKGKNYASSFWYDDYDTSFDYLEQYGSFQKKDLDAYKKTHNLYKLASVRRAVSNFVQIVTNKPIPVSFATKSDSKTDGQKVILSADVDDNFDVSVGLALHEGSHIILSDFKLLKQIADLRNALSRISSDIRYINEMNISNGKVEMTKDETDKYIEDYVQKYIHAVSPDFKTQMNDIYSNTGKIGSKGYPTDEVVDIIQGLTNWIEDRRIDHYIYNSAPGYRDYYVSMYDHYFNDKAVTKGVKSDEFTNETFESYMFRIINLLNSETNLTKLKGLRAIYRKLDLKNIHRLKTTTQSLELAIDIVDEILRYVPMQEQPKAAGNGDGNNKDGQSNGKQGDSDVNETGDNENEQMGGASGNAPTMGEESETGKDMLSKSAADQLAKKFQKQKDFLNGNLKKKKLTNQENQKLDDIQESGTELVRVGSDLTNDRGERIGKGVDCIVVKKLTKKLMESDDFPFTNRRWNDDRLNSRYEDDVKRGVMLGTLLGKKLQIRNESRETVFNRLKKGKIDGRLIATLGYDNENVFYTKDVDQFKKANLHISIDYSGSMSGSKIKKAITSTVAIVKACEMARNINTQVSIRSTDTGGRGLPYIALVHDSRRDSFRQFCDYMGKLEVTNTTPEGLCFEAIMKQLIPTTNDMDSYFLNFSDGQPTYSINHGGDDIHYGGRNAAEHTYRQVKKMMGNGINILSYFITDYGGSNFEHSTDWEIFKKSYGNDAKYVNVENMFEVAKTMNEMFLKKS